MTTYNRSHISANVHHMFKEAWVEMPLPTRPPP